MNIIIGKKLNQPVYKNVYKFVIKFMYGDADGYGKEVLYVDKDDKNLERFINFLNNCDKAYPHGRRGYDSYDIVEDYWLFCEEWCDPSKRTEEERKIFEENEDIFFFWQNDPRGDGFEASFDGYNITFFDENSIQYKVEVKF